MIPLAKCAALMCIEFNYVLQSDLGWVTWYTVLLLGLVVKCVYYLFIIVKCIFGPSIASTTVFGTTVISITV